MKKFQMTFLAFLAFALRPLCHNDADLVGGGGGLGAKEQLEGTNMVPAYPFRDDLRNTIIDGMTTSDVVEFTEGNAPGTEEGTPLYNLAETITAQFEEFLAEKGISAEDPVWDAIAQAPLKKGAPQHGA